MKRRALFILLLLVAGAIVNVAVAWVCVLSLQRTPATLTVNFTGWDEFVSSRWLRVADDDWPPPPSHGAHAQGLGAQRLDMVMGTDEPTMRIFRATYLASGFPLESLEGDLIQLPSDTTPMRRRVLGNLKDGTAIPLDPTWPGFAINTVFYAFILWLLFTVPFALRRRRRIKRGLCPKCAYPVGTNQVCTECGAAVGPKAVPS